MEHLYLADLKDFTEEEIKQHLVSEYAYWNDGGEESCRKRIDTLDIVIAYESVGDYDSIGWFLFKDTQTGELFELHGSHCSCYGFEDQFDLEETSIEYLTSDRFLFCAGWDDEQCTENELAINQFIQQMKTSTI